MRIMSLAAITAVTAIAATGSAQSNFRKVEVTPVNLSLRVGVGLPLDKAFRDFGNTPLALGLEYQFSRPLLASGETYIALDTIGSNLGKRKGTITPLTLNQRFYSKNTDSILGRRTYFFVGAGLAFIDLGTSEAALAARAGLGTELGTNIFFEAAGIVSDRKGGARANSIGFYLGYRF